MMKLASVVHAVHALQQKVLPVFVLHKEQVFGCSFADRKSLHFNSAAFQIFVVLFLFGFILAILDFGFFLDSPSLLFACFLALSYYLMAC